MSVCVVGAGLAGLRVCEALREQGYAGTVTLVGAEAHPPYSRPPLSKEVLRGDAGVEIAQLRSRDALDDLDLNLRLGVAANGLSVAERTVHLAGGSTVSADHVVIATGTAVRRIPAIDGGNVHVLRTVDDCVGLRAALAPGTRLAVVGAGFIGLEVAASARHRGCEVTVIDVLAEPLARVIDPSVGAALRRLHESHGVRFRLGTGVEGVTSEGDLVTAVRLADGTSVPADAVVVAIGVRPETGWLAGSGLDVADGVLCDATLAAAPGVWAVGDVARWPHWPFDTPTRVEHWTNALEQAQAVATSIATGEAAAYSPVPYVWSDQYDAKLQILGTAAGDETRVITGSLDAPKWAALVRRGDSLAGIIGLRAAGQVMRRRGLLINRISWDEAVTS